MPEHRVLMLRASLRRRIDPSRSRDPHIRAIVAQLGELDIAPAPDPAFRAELRAQLVAIAPRIIAESANSTAGVPHDRSDRVAEVEQPGKRQAGHATRAPAAAPARHARIRERRVPIKRPVQIVTALLAVCAVLLGGAVWLSRTAVPGDNLYGLKRASERVELALDTNDADRAHDRLNFARTRVAEVRTLWTRSTSQAIGRGPTAASVSSQTATLIDEALSSADSDVTTAARLLNDQAVRNRSADPLQTMTSWAHDQLSALAFIRSQMPDGSLRDRAIASWHVVDAASNRSSDLRPQVASACAKTSDADRFGPIPCTSTPTTRTPAPGGGTSPATPTQRSGSVGPGTGSGSRSGNTAPRRSSGPTS